MKTLRHSLWLALLLLAGCSVIQSQDGSPIPEDGQFAVLPLINLSQTPQADALTSMVGEINAALRGYTDGRRVQVAPTPASRAATLAPPSIAPIYTR